MKSNLSSNSSLKLDYLSKFISIFGWLLAIGFYSYSVLSYSVPSSADVSGGDYFKENLDSFKISMLALLFGFAGERISMVVADMAREKRQDNSHSELISAISSSAAIQYVGPSNSVRTELYKSILNSTSVKNTFLNVGGAPGISSAIENDICGIYEKFLSADNSNSWSDIISVNELHDFRHTRIFKNKSDACGEHRISVIKSTMPIINFIIIENSQTRFKEVYFGWVYDKAKTVTSVYKSSDQSIIDLFELHFDILWREKASETWSVDYSKDIHTRGPNRRFIVNKAGIWVNTLIGPNNNIVNHAVIRINFGKNGPLIEGVIIESGKIKHIRHVDFINSFDKTLIEYSELSNSGVSIGFCLYKFIKQRDGDIIKGYLVEPPSLSRSFIFGVRSGVNDVDFNNIEEVSGIIEGKKDLIESLVKKEIHLKSENDGSSI
ncbi:hypothetical protein [Asticcacaulis sp. AND118]|uniref:hypothetical protein n=1 Tax=Asticcacaulis sp. AND118 TaxID=2840468 RepID=UPI001CFFFE36|nr:hypothetical protein [Asticcacaulis sp. AND118]UDF05352.1 hypothetical protein LH365_14175 [Asticcacaulis sp. AND118]